MGMGKGAGAFLLTVISIFAPYALGIKQQGVASRVIIIIFFFC